jgi:DtxR family Mn-dependent transcriptional regulator
MDLGMPKESLVSSEATDDYLKAIFELANEDRKASTSEIARKLGISAASVTGMLQKLAANAPPMVSYEKRRGAELTVEGERRALEVIRHHRLLESYLHEALGYRWDEVHQEAERLEHFISEDFEERVANRLGDPEFDPHGHPIPRKDGTMPPCDDIPLHVAPQGSEVRVSRVSDDDPDVLRRLASTGLTPNAVLRIVEHDAVEGPTLLRGADEQDLPVDASIVSRIRVRVLRENVTT